MAQMVQLVSLFCNETYRFRIIHVFHGFCIFVFSIDAAGAIVDGGTVNRIENNSSSLAKDALRSHDAYNFFKQDNDESLIITGPTGTNVADVCVTLVC